MQKKRLFAAITAVALSGAMLVGCTTASNPASTNEPAPTSAAPEAPEWQSKLTDDGRLKEPAKIIFSTASNAVLDITAPLWADQLGILKKYGITMEVQNVATTAAVPLLATGQVDVILGGLNAGLFNAVYSGSDLKVVGPNNYQDPNTTIGFYTSNKVTGGKLTTENLKGQTVASSQGTQGITMVALLDLLKSLDLKLDDVKVTTMPQTDQVVALQTGAIALGTPSPAGTLALIEAKEATWAARQIPEGWPVVVYMYGPSLLKDRPEVGAAFLAAMRELYRDYLTPGYSENPEVVSAIAKATGQTEEAIQQSTEFIFTSELAIPDDYISRMDSAWRLVPGQLASDKPMTTDQIVDTDFMKYVNGLG
ncbi:MAG: ABC transporter substrate-binding protein [Microbacterium sp.]